MWPRKLCLYFHLLQCVAGSYVRIEKQHKRSQFFFQYSFLLFCSHFSNRFTVNYKTKRKSNVVFYSHFFSSYIVKSFPVFYFPPIFFLLLTFRIQNLFHIFHTFRLFLLCSFWFLYFSLPTLFKVELILFSQFPFFLQFSHISFFIASFFRILNLFQFFLYFSIIFVLHSRFHGGKVFHHSLAIVMKSAILYSLVVSARRRLTGGRAKIALTYWAAFLLAGLRT